MEKKEMLYEGKAKRVFRTEDPGKFLVEFKNDATAFDGKKKGTIENKGMLNNKISSFFFRLLEEKGIKTHFIKEVSDTEMLVKPLEIVLVEVVVRNIAAGSLAKRIGMDEGTPLPAPVVEYYYKRDDLGDPLINGSHIAVLGLATPAQMEHIKETALKVNEVLKEFLAGKKIELVDFKLEFGKHGNEILLGDEISPDTCRFWDSETREKLDKDRFRRDMGNVEGAYQEIYRRIQS
ncbi:MAG: phosphoribosylaminoimidazolesuccinocarboxamide synthase [Bacillota bacterium]